MERGWERVQKNWECMFVRQKQRLFLSMAGKMQSMALMWKEMMKNVDSDEPTSSLDHVYEGCTQREHKPNEAIIEQCNVTMCLNPRISAGATENVRDGKNLSHKR